METTYKVRIYPNPKQQQLIQKTFGCTRFVYNYYLTKRKEEYSKSGKDMSLSQMIKDLTFLKQELPWLQECDKCALQNSLKDLNLAYVRFFRHQNNYPVYKSKKEHYKSYKTNYNKGGEGHHVGNIEITHHYLKLPKLGWVKYRDNRTIQGRLLNVVISQDSQGLYFAKICCTDMESHTIQYQKTGKNVGIDLGILEFAILSDGIRVPNPKFYNKNYTKIQRLHKSLSRKTRYSKNYNKTRIKLAKAYYKMGCQKNDFINKLSTDIVKNYDVIVMEGMDVQEMRRTNNTKINRSITYVGWGKFRQMICYKCNWHGKKYIALNRAFPSTRMCHCCGYISDKIPTNIRIWSCPICNTELERDLNASINLLNEGLKIIS